MAKQKHSKRQDGRLSANFVYEGKRYYVYGRSAQELKQAEMEKRQALEAGRQDHDNPTLNAYYEVFTENRRTKIKEATIRCQSFQFRDCANVVIDRNKRTLGEYRIRDIKPGDVRKVQQALEASGRTTTTVNNCIDHLSHVFNKAVRDELIDRNPCKSLDRVKRTEKPARDTIHRALSAEETTAFFREAAQSYYLNMFRVMISTGMRTGELGALAITDIDTKQGMIRINKTITKDENGCYHIGETPKTDAGNREIPLTPAVMDYIRDQRQINRMLHGIKIETTIFRGFEGGLLREHTVNREIARICKRAGIEKFTCHAFRATFATRFIEQRPQDYKILSELLGHSDVSITLNLYTHAMKEGKIKAMNDIVIAM